MNLTLKSRTFGILFANVGFWTLHATFNLGDFIRKVQTFSHGQYPFFIAYCVQTGFLEILKTERKNRRIIEISLLTLKQEASLGAAYLGAKEVGIKLPLDYNSNAEVFFNAKFWIVGLEDIDIRCWMNVQICERSYYKCICTCSVCHVLF